MKSSELIKELQVKYPICCKENKSLFEDVAHALLVLEDISGRIGVPPNELLEFFYRTKLKIDTIEKQEEVFNNNVRQTKNTM